MTLPLILDIAVAALLVVTIVYATILNRRLTAMRRDRKELAAVAASFEKAIARAGDSVTKLRTSTENLQESIGKAESLRDDLAFLLERGGSAADRLEAAVRAARREGATIGPASPVPVEEAAPERVEPAPLRAPRRAPPRPARDDMNAERDLLRALQAAR